MGRFLSFKKKKTAPAEGGPASGHVQAYEPRPVPPAPGPPCTAGPFQQYGPPYPHPHALQPNEGFTPSPSHPGPYCYPPNNNIVVNHYYVAAPGAPGPGPGSGSGSGIPAALGKLRLGSVVNLATDLVPMNLPHFFDNGPPAGHVLSAPTRADQSAALYNQLSLKFDRIMTSIDNDRFDVLEAELLSFLPAGACTQAAPASALAPVPVGAPGPAPVPALATDPYYEGKHASSLLASVKPGHYFAKVDLYANSRLPYELPPVHLYLASYRLLSLAARFSDRAYEPPQSCAEKHTHIDADWRAGTKAMVIQSVPMDDANAIVFAIRGTANFMDWAVNLDIAPASPAGFLDDPGNLCHSGFLSTARKMVPPVALRLRQLLEEDPGRASYSLVITGHSAGGAVASLLYAHMLATSTQAASELNLLTGCFRRMHCITFGAPPVSLLPLQTPQTPEGGGGGRLTKSLFYSFVNEGDPVARADKAYVKSLLDLFASSVPAGAGVGAGKGKAANNDAPKPKPVWNVPPATLSNAGRIIVLRSGNPHGGRKGKKTVEEWLSEGVVAQFTSDEQLRGVIWGDPVCHAMKLYAGRIEALAIAAMMVDV